MSKITRSKDDSKPGPSEDSTRNNCLHVSASNEAESAGAQDLPMFCQEARLKLGQVLHETPFSNRNHEKKWWFSVVFIQNQVKLCGSAKVWLGARESSLCLTGSCFMFHVPFGSVSQTCNLGFRWRWHEIWCRWRQHLLYKGHTLSRLAVYSCFPSIFLLERIICLLNISLGFSLKKQNY